MITEVSVPLRLLDVQLKELISEYVLKCRVFIRNTIEQDRLPQISNWLNTLRAEITERVLAINRVMLLVAVNEATEGQNAMQACFRKSVGFVLDAITGLLAGSIASLDYVRVF